MKLGLAYPLGRSLYVPVTCRSNCLTLPQTRGPSFKLPEHVVCSLNLVRSLELGAPQKQETSVETSFLLSCPPPPIDKLEENVNHEKFSAEVLSSEVKAYDASDFDSLVFAGEGEPTLRLDTVLAITRTIRKDWKSIRLTTNGLVMDADSTAKALHEAGVDLVSVTLPTHCAEQYDQLMCPNLGEKDASRSSSLDIVSDFIVASQNAGMGVELTAVDRPDVCKKQTLAFAQQLLSPSAKIRWRKYFP